MPAPLGTVSHYELLQRVGAGGMGEVYLARDTVLQRQVAIKFLHTADAGDAEAARQLRREAQTAAALDHPNICAIYEVGADDGGRSFIVMQYVEGETLASKIRRGTLTIGAALELAHGIVDALDAAHSRGVIHRDLKPQNIIVTPAGLPKLLDFGIARLQPVVANDGWERTTHLTSAVAGTPAYMAPEILQGHPADARSDLFSLGVVLYECLTGHLPFRGTTPQEIWGNVLHVEPVAPSVHNAAVGPELDGVCQRLLAKQPGARFQSAAEVRGALQVLQTQTRPLHVPAPRRPYAFAALAAALALAIVVGGWWLASSPSLPLPSPAAEAWYGRGIEAVRQGAYASGRRALEEAVRLFPDYALAHSRLAEVQSALDDERGAQASLIRVSVLVPDQARLPRDDRLRLDAIRAMVLRDFDRAIAAYAELAQHHPADAGALVDLGRAQEAAGQLAAARDSYERATTLDQQFAAGFLRLGSVLGETGALSDALGAFDEAARLYGLGSNAEGQVETLLQRAAKLDAAGRAADGARAAEEAGRIARQAGLESQAIRAEFLRGSGQVGGGAFAAGEATVRAAVDGAMAAGLQGIAADGLIDMAGTLLARGRIEESDRALERAYAIATDRSLTRTAMRAAAQRASLKLQNGEPRDALKLLEAPLAYFASARYRRLEAVALVIAARAHQDVGAYGQATELLGPVLAFAAESHNGELTAQARSSLATLAVSQGRLPEALEHREEAVRLRRALGDTETLPYDLTNQAEVLIRLGRRADAEGLLSELEAGIVSGTGAFPTRARRVGALRALLAVTVGDYTAARALAIRVDGRSPRGDEAGQLAVALHAVAAARLGAKAALPALPESLDQKSPGGREVRLWRAIASLDGGQPRDALDTARALLAEGPITGGTEFEWRVAAVAAAAGLRDPEASRLARQALDRFEQLRKELGASVSTYQMRQDVSSILGAARAVVDRATPVHPG